MPPIQRNPVAPIIGHNDRQPLETRREPAQFPEPTVAILTAGRDRPYALGLASALIVTGATFDFIGSDEVNISDMHGHPQINFFNLRGEQSVDAGLLRKIRRVLVYYSQLMIYAATAKPKIFHILWNNKFEWVDRTALMLFYRLLGKKIVLTVHNVNIGERDATDSWLNRSTLKFQYRMCDHLFVHTNRMKQELISGFDADPGKVAVIPFGINHTVPDTPLTGAEAREYLGLEPAHRVILFFGNIAPYKGLEFLVDAFELAAGSDRGLRLLVVGRPKGAEEYWSTLLGKINRSPSRNQMVLKIEYVPDAETEIYFKAADVLVLPYTHIYQSGVLSLGYGFGLPVVATDVGSLKEEVIEGKTGFVIPPKNPKALADAIQAYFSSDLYKDPENHRSEIKDYANERYSWAKVAAITTAVYAKLNNRLSEQVRS